ncbi:thrombopoietin receptor [Protobothrops mucrosquamatus]|uniref:thrombopoietin receptor n=1 Tax=Protobothrops mucrosquamatus TaxID=103944 RepID=UPI0010FB5F49|nr:thrombopoietin receptor [Protobothrops mucrosquamatus]
MAVNLCSMTPLPFLVMLLLTILRMLHFVLVTDKEAILLAQTAQNVLCFSRTFEDLTCFWDEPAHVKGAYRFFYTYEGDKSRECALISTKNIDGSWRHICTFPGNYYGIQLFIELNIEVLDSVSNHTIFSQYLRVNTVGLIAPPTNITVEWPGIAQQLLVNWMPPSISYADFLIYEVLYGVEDSIQAPFRIEVKNSYMCQLKNLLPGQQYHIQVRSKPDGLSLDGIWGPWSPAATAGTPHLSDSVIMIVAIALLLCAGLVLGLGFTCLSNYSSVKQKLWPRIPDLHRVLDGFFQDNGKQQQQQVNALFCNKMLEDVPLTCLLEVLSEKPLETRSFDPLLDMSLAEQTEWGSQPSSHQHYMVLSSNNPQSSHHENEYFDDTNDNGNAFPQTLEHDLHVTSEPMTQIIPFTLLNVPSEIKEERRQEISDDQATSVTDISNQTYLLMG